MSRLSVGTMCLRERAAMEFAAQQHSGQFRRYANEPYIHHPAAVVDIVRSVPHTPAMLRAAWCHDVLEDTDTRAGELRQVIGDDALSLVQMLTNDLHPHKGRKGREEANRERLSQSMPQAQTIKLADVFDNCSTVVERAPKFAAVYLPEKLELLNFLRDGDPVLWRRAHAVIMSGLRQLDTQADRQRAAHQTN